MMKGGMGQQNSWHCGDGWNNKRMLEMTLGSSAKVAEEHKISRTFKHIIFSQ